LLYSQHFLSAIVVISVAGLADAFDGIVARVQEKTSRYGDFLDHVADRMSDTALAVGWMLGSGVRVELAFATAIVVMLNGYIGTQIEATWKVRSYEGMGRGEFVLALIVFPIVSHILVVTGWDKQTFTPFIIAEWLTLILIAFVLLGVLHRFALAARLERSP